LRLGKMLTRFLGGQRASDRVIPDTSIIVKVVLKPGKWLPRSVYELELETCRKSRLLIKLLNEKGVELLIPFATLVGVADMLTRLAFERQG